MRAYYNEIDPFAAQWLRELIKAGHIAPGFVDERSIEDVKPDELLGYTQCHFFAGIGVWSYALRLAGWPDDKPVWTGSCPCQPFSAAGKGKGFNDERHLWPAFHWLIQQFRPPIVFGEQVANVPAWIDLVQADVEAMGYAFGCVAFPAASVGAPHIRDRAFWVADSTHGGRQEELPNAGRRAVGDRAQGLAAGLVHGGGAGGLGNSGFEPRERIAGGISGAQTESSSAWSADGRHGNGYSDAGEDGDGISSGRHWDDCDWLYCRDGKYRPVEPGTFPLVDGAAARVGRLRGYGNAIVAQQAEAFIKAVMEATA